jgi:very-short-patch-repair endonuclease
LDVEVDGFQHGSPENQVNDAIHDAFLESGGIKVLRFWGFAFEAGQTSHSG